MIVPAVFAAVVLIFTLLLAAKIRLEIKFLGGSLDFKVKYLCFTVFPLKKKEKKEKKKRLKTAKNKLEEDKTFEQSYESANDVTVSTEEVKEDVSEAADTAEEIAEDAPEKEKEKLFDTAKVRIQQGKLLWETAKKVLIKLFRGIRITGFMIDFTVSGKDACEAAVNYGKASAAVYNGIAVLKTFFKVTVKTVDIGCDYYSGKNVYDCAANITLGLGTAAGLIITALVGYLKNKPAIDKLGRQTVDDSEETPSEEELASNIATA